MMPGCKPAAYARIAPFLDKMAAQAAGRPCCALIGPGGAGHYVKMVHNGIEYADMQLIAEAYDILASAYGLSAAAIGDVFAAWNATELKSYLIEIAAIVLRKRDATGGALVDAILDEAEQKGTGRWTAQSALDLGVPVTAITEAVYARALSARRDLRLLASEAYPRRPPAPLAPAPADLEAIRRALYAAKIVSYAQGFEMMSAASELYGWKLNLGEIAAIWRGGCIIRARMLDRIMQAYAAAPPPVHLLLAADFRDAVVAAESDWRRVVALAVERGRDPGLLVDARLLRRSAPGARPGQSAAGPARLFRRAHLSPARQARRVPYALGSGRRGSRSQLRRSAQTTAAFG